MNNAVVIGNGGQGPASQRRPAVGSDSIHPAWAEFIRYCQQLQFGELEKVKIQNGIPMVAEVTIRKVKFGP